MLTLTGDFGVYTESALFEVIAGTLPTAAFTYTDRSLTVTFDGSDSTASPWATVLSYEWNWGDGQIDDSSSPTDSHTYQVPGDYRVTLTVIDTAYARSATTSRIVTVTAPAPQVTTAPPTTTPVQPTPPPPAPTVSAKIGSTASSRGTVSAVLSCPATQTACTGTVQLRTARPVAVHPRRKTKPKRAVLTLGKASFAIRRGNAPWTRSG
jgi:PKD repeat protein